MRIVYALIMLLLVRSACVSACSVSPDYRVPTTLQLVEQADAIILARVEDSGVPVVPGINGGRLVPFSLLKGNELPNAVKFDDAALTGQGNQVAASDPRNLVDTHPDAFRGACNRYEFNRGTILVVFLKREGREFAVFAPAFSRALEDVPSADALWVKAVKLYIGIAALPKQQRRKAIETQQFMLEGNFSDPDDRLLAQELNRALRDMR